MVIDTKEPDEIIAGDTIKWEKSLSDYLASAGWSLTYVLLNAAGKITITSSADGSDHLISVDAVTSAAYSAGLYDWTLTVSNGSERYTIGNGRIEVKPDPTQQTTFDGRSTARKILEGLQSAYESYVNTKQQGMVANYNIAGRSMAFRSSAEIVEQIEYWKSEVSKEDKASRIKNGLKSGNRVLTRFNR